MYGSIATRFGALLVAAAAHAALAALLVDATARLTLRPARPALTMAWIAPVAASHTFAAPAPQMATVAMHLRAAAIEPPLLPSFTWPEGTLPVAAQPEDGASAPVLVAARPAAEQAPGAPGWGRARHVPGRGFAREGGAALARAAAESRRCRQGLTKPDGRCAENSSPAALEATSQNLRP